MDPFSSSFERLAGIETAVFQARLVRHFVCSTARASCSVVRFSVSPLWVCFPLTLHRCVNKTCTRDTRVTPVRDVRVRHRVNPIRRQRQVLMTGAAQLAQLAAAAPSTRRRIRTCPSTRASASRAVKSRRSPTTARTAVTLHFAAHAALRAAAAPGIPMSSPHRELLVAAPRMATSRPSQTMVSSAKPTTPILRTRRIRR